MNLKRENMKIDFKKPNGLIPVITQEYGTNEILMLGHMNNEALDLTIETKIVHYFSRSKNKIWKKEENNRDIQKLIDLKVNSNLDTILVVVEQITNNLCNTDKKSYFSRSYLDKKNENKKIIIQSKSANLPTKYGKFNVKAYKDGCQEHLAIMSKDFCDIDIPLVRVHSECLTGDSVGSLKCDCNSQLDLALQLISKEGGLVIYHRQEGRNIGLVNKINAYNLQDQGYNTIDANLKLGFKDDERNYDAIGFIFKDLNLNKIKLITNNPKKIKFVENCNIQIVERIPSITKTNQYNKNYLQTKKKHMGHLL